MRSCSRAVKACVCLLVLASMLGMVGVLWKRPASAAEGHQHLAESERIAALLDVVEHSSATFVREGREYSGAEGRKHLERKLLYTGNRIRTAEEFIEQIATRSLLTGRPYLVRLATGEEMEAGVWLHRKLAEIDALR